MVLGVLGAPLMWLFCLIYSLLAKPSFLPTLGLVTIGTIVISLLLAKVNPDAIPLIVLPWSGVLLFVLLVAHR